MTINSEGYNNDCGEVLKLATNIFHTLFTYKCDSIELLNGLSTLVELTFDSLYTRRIESQILDLEMAKC